MPDSGYEIKLYQPSLLPQVVGLLSLLWGDNHDQNISYFRWKYHDNPFTENPLGIVALHNGKVVGFRGYFATKWQIGREDSDLTFLSPGDAVVDPAHRLKRLSVIMGEFAMDEYEPKYKLFFNFSASIISVPGNLRMKFIPIVDKYYLNRGNILGLLKFILTMKNKKKLYEGKITFGDFGNITVSDSPKPKEMAAVANRQGYDGQKIKLLQNEDFFRWRFSNKRKKYAFYYYRNDNIITGYVVINVSGNNKRGYISDFCADDSATIEKILAFILNKKHFEIVSIYNYSLTDAISPILRKLHFKTNSLTRIIEKRKKGEVPLFVRPVRHDYSETDCFINGLDIRKINSWEIKEICSDGA